MRLAAAVAAAALAGIGLTAAQPEPRRSGGATMSPALRAMQADDAANPAMLWVAEGEAMWRRPAGDAGVACAACHGEAATSMVGVAARYPAFDAVLGRPLDLQGRVNQCRERHQGAPALGYESDALLGLVAYVALQSRGLPAAPPADQRLAPFRERGAALYTTRMGQLDLACAHCHDERWGGRLGGSAIPQAWAIAYPVYRLEWQALGSLQRRFRNCLVGVRAEPFPYGAEELVELELFLMARAGGMPLEAPGVRP
jgi:sulfur-oxidizing protein SoxA